MATRAKGSVSRLLCAFSALLLVCGCPNPDLGTSPDLQIPPLTPSDLLITNPTLTSVDVSWSPSSGASSYQVFRFEAADGAFGLLKYDDDGTSFTDTGLASGMTYYYRVRAIGRQGPGGLSEAVAAETTFSGPAAPPGVTAGNPSVAAADVMWGTSPGAIGYQVYRALSTAGPFYQVYSGGALTFTDSLPAYGSRYFYKVRATDQTGLGPFSPVTPGFTLAADISGGSGSSSPHNLTTYNGALYFTANDGSGDGNQLFRFDGTAATKVPSGVSNFNPNYLTVYRGLLYFQASNGGPRLYATDGTTMQAIIPTVSGPQYLTVMGTELYLSANDTSPAPLHGLELWGFDGMSAARIADINPIGTAGSNPAQLVALGSELYFSANDGTNGRQLWKTDGSAGGTVMAANLSPGELATTSPMTALNSALYFPASADGASYYLYRFDGITATQVSTVQVQVSSAMAVYNGSLYMAATDGSDGYELYRLDGSTATRVTDLTPGPGSGLSPTVSFRVFNGALYFGGATDGVSYQLYRYDGVGVSLAQTINLGGSANPTQFGILNSRLYFQANSAPTGTELCVQY